MSAIPSDHPSMTQTTRLTALGVDRPWLTILICVGIAMLFGAAFPWAKIDTNPKNMLPPESAVRVWNDQVNQRFGLHEDTIVVAIQPDNGVLNAESLKKLQQFSSDVLGLQGIVKGDVTSLYTVDNVTASGDSLRIAPLLAAAPTSADGVQALRKQLFEGTLFVDRLISRDEKTTAVYVPLEKGADGAKLATAIREAALKSFTPQQIYITGDPVARDLFGAEMFKLMGLFAPIAGALMMGLMFWMFRSWWLAGVMMLTAMVSIMVAMGAGIALGFPVHIMSSMAPVFLMAIATDSIHIFNEFFQRYRPGMNRAEVVRQTIGAVSRPVRYTALATALGFAVLLFMTIVPVQVFGGIIVLGTVVLRLLSFYLVPACLMLVPLPPVQPNDDVLSRLTGWVATWAVRASKLTIGIAVLLMLFSVWGASKSVVDNNMLRWFKEGSEVRQADALFSREMGGAMPASLVVDTGKPDGIKDPAVLKAIEAIQKDLASQQLVGTSLSVADYLRRINLVLNAEAPSADVLPSDAAMAGQYLMAFSMGARPSDLNRVVDYDYQRANVLLQLRSGDAQLMQRVEDRVQTLVREQSMPFTVTAAGPAHFNLVWNQEVLNDMILGFAIALVVVFGVLAADFRSLKWALVAYVPLLGTVLIIFGALGWVGKTIDMPVAVLACLSLGMAVDFAIHFVTRYRQRCQSIAATRPLTEAERHDALKWVIQWPGKGIVRNALMFAVAFAVMLAAPLTPYITVGAFIVLMMSLSAVASLTLLPALIKTFRL
ncbi:MAG: RND family transporter [Rhizobacter sp.]